jgi:small subunit ribosomal protein S1
VNIGDTIDAVVLKVDKANEKISLGLKQTEPDPWLTLDQKYPPRTRVKGKVRNLTNFGAFVELEEGIDGLVHVSDMSWTKRVAHPSEVLKKGDTVEVVILSIDKEHRRISLGLKQVSDDPWPELADKFPSGLEVKGAVIRLFDRGAIVDLGEGIEGFIPLSQIGIDDLKRPGDAFEPGEELTMKVTRVDVPNHRLILSVKAWLAEQDDIALAEWTSKRNQVRARIAANPPVEEPPAEPKPAKRKGGPGEEAEEQL